jgi:putative protease
MTVTSPEGLRYAQRLGVDRCVLARETSLRELEKFPPPSSTDIPLEVFVHGALCVAYSGQCLTSESLGQRSANRGECAQACRLPYTLHVDGQERDLGDKRYLLSPRDLAAVDDIPKLIELGITSFKIEGRLKSPEYVAAVTRVYREAIDKALNTGTPEKTNRRYELEMAFSRGLFSGWMHGVDHQELVHARYGKKRGALVGRITSAGHDWIEIDRSGYAIRAGDGIVIDTGGDTEKEQGGRVIGVRGARLVFEPGRIDTRSPGLVGARVWKTSDPHLDRELRATYSGIIPINTEPLRVTVSGCAGAPLIVTASVAKCPTPQSVASGIPLQVAQKKPITSETLRDQLGRLGGTSYHLDQLENNLVGNVILPFSELARVRRELVELLDAAPRTQSSSPNLVTRDLAAIKRKRVASSESRKLAVLCRDDAQIDGALDANADLLYLDFEDLRRYKDAVARVRGTLPRVPIYLATPRIQKAGEDGFFKLLENAAPDGFLIRNLGAIEFFRGRATQLIGDFSLNIANPLSAARVIEDGLNRLTSSYDLNIDQLCDLLSSTPSEWFEIVLHQHMPMFHMEHCVFAAFMSNGRDYRDCGRPCETHRVELRDRVGQLHPLRADVGCRNTLFNGRAQTGAAFIDRLLATGARTFRIELLNESREETARLIHLYRDLITGYIPARDVVNRVRAISQLGVTGGTLTVL